MTALPIIDEGHRCAGGCCERFTLPFGPTEMWRSWRQARGLEPRDGETNVKGLHRYARRKQW